MAGDNSARSPQRQIILIGAAAISGAILLFLLWFLLRTPYSPAFTGINSTDALTITQELEKLKMPYELADEGTTIMVPQDRVDAARVNILGGELPLKGAVGFELFNKTDMGLTEFAQKINYQRALQGELARTIMALDEIETARVHLSLPEAGIFQQDRRPAKASITIATKLGGTIGSNVVRGIQQLVAQAVPDLQAANVAILNAHGELLSDAPTDALLLAATPEALERQAFEQRYASRIEEAVRAAGLAMPMSVRVTALKTFQGRTGDAGSQPNGASVTTADDQAFEEGRNFPLNVQVAVAVEPSPAIRQTLVTTIRAAIGYEASLGDIISVQTDPALAGNAPQMPTSSRSAPLKQSSLPGAGWPQVPLWPFFVAVLVFLALFLFFRLRNPPATSLSVDERQAFAEKIKALLEKEGRNDPFPL